MTSLHVAVKRGHFELYGMFRSTCGGDLPDEFLMNQEYLTSVEIVKDLLKVKLYFINQTHLLVVWLAQLVENWHFTQTLQVQFLVLACGKALITRLYSMQCSNNNKRFQERMLVTPT